MFKRLDIIDVIGGVLTVGVIVFGVVWWTGQLLDFIG